MPLNVILFAYYVHLSFQAAVRLTGDTGIWVPLRACDMAVSFIPLPPCLASAEVKEDQAVTRKTPGSKAGFLPSNTGEASSLACHQDMQQGWGWGLSAPGNAPPQETPGGGGPTGT